MLLQELKQFSEHHVAIWYSEFGFTFIVLFTFAAIYALWGVETGNVCVCICMNFESNTLAIQYWSLSHKQWQFRGGVTFWVFVMSVGQET